MESHALVECDRVTILTGTGRKCSGRRPVVRRTTARSERMSIRRIVVWLVGRRPVSMYIYTVRVAVDYSVLLVRLLISSELVDAVVSRIVGVDCRSV